MVETRENLKKLSELGIEFFDTPGGYFLALQHVGTGYIAICTKFTIDGFKQTLVELNCGVEVMRKREL